MDFSKEGGCQFTNFILVARSSIDVEASGC